jgi:hypothetical protein
MIAESLVRKQRFVKLNDRPLQPRQGFPELFVVGSVVGGGPRRNSGNGRTSVTRITRIGRLIMDGSAQRRYHLERTCLNSIRVNKGTDVIRSQDNLRLYLQPGHEGAHTCRALLSPLRSRKVPRSPPHLSTLQGIPGRHPPAFCSYKSSLPPTLPRPDRPPLRVFKVHRRVVAPPVT